MQDSCQRFGNWGRCSSCTCACKKKRSLSLWMYKLESDIFCLSPALSSVLLLPSPWMLGVCIVSSYRRVFLSQSASCLGCWMKLSIRMGLEMTSQLPTYSFFLSQRDSYSMKNRTFVWFAEILVNHCVSLIQPCENLDDEANVSEKAATQYKYPDVSGYVSMYKYLYNTCRTF